MLRASSSIYLQQLWQRPPLQTANNETNKPAEREQPSGDQGQEDDDLTPSSLDFPPPPTPPRHGDHRNAADNDYDDLSIIVLHPEPGIANFHHSNTTPGRRQTKTYHFLYQDGDSSCSSAGTASLPPTPTLPCPPPAPSQSADLLPKVGLLRRESSRLSLKRKNLTRKLKRAMSFTKSSTSGAGKRPSSTET